MRTPSGGFAGVGESESETDAGHSASIPVDPAANEQRLLRNRIALLERQLYETKREALAEREYLLNQHDRFIRDLIDEHDALVERLGHERDEACARVEKAMRELYESRPRGDTHPGLGKAGAPATSEPPKPPDQTNLNKLVNERDRSREMLRRLQAQRDHAQRTLRKLTDERDALAAELERMAPGRLLTDPTTGTEEARRTDPNPIPALDLLGMPFAERETPASVHDRVTAPPAADELSAAIIASRPTAVPPLESAVVLAKPALKRKPNPTLNPLGGYSVSGEEVAPEQLETLTSSRPPNR